MSARWMLLWFLALQVVHGQEIRVVVLEGDGALNNIKLERAKEPVVRVETTTGRPVEGAAVHFTAPSSGPGARFGSGASATAMSDARGIAIGRGLRPNRTAGQFEIRVTASWAGETATARLTQTNVEPIELDQKGSRKFALLAILGGAAAGGAILAALAGGGGGTVATRPPAGAPPASAPGLTITPGTPVFGAP
jgi:hypothetical protein